MTGETAFFTICARNYLAFASVLGESVVRQHPEASFTVWLLDPGELPEGVSLPEGVDVRPIAHAVDAASLADLRFYYDILELATAVKPRCFAAHFREGAKRTIYLDPDILLFRPLDRVTEALEGENPALGVLTPHIMSPLPRDDCRPDDLVLLQAGLYNLGFLALRRDSRSDALLDWWWGWLQTHCFTDKASGTFTDQKWLNFAPVFWPEMHTLRDTSYNVAYWNLSQRKLERRDDGFWVDGEPLTFFHYSGFNPRHPGVLSKHQTRIDVRRGSVLGDLLEDYAARVFEWGHDELSQLDIEAPRFANGIVVDGIARQAYRDAKRQGLEFDRPREIGVGSFYAWLCGPVFRDVENRVPLPITRYLLTIYQMREDVRQFYPDLYGADREGFVDWVRKSAEPDLGADATLLANQFAVPGEVQDSMTASVAPAPLQVNFAGYLRAALGIGEAARGYARAMIDQGIDVQFVDATLLTSSPSNDESLDLSSADRVGGASAAINLIHINADQLFNFRDHVGPAFFESRYNIGIWAWETLDFPQHWHDRFALLDEIWVGSSFIADAIAAVSPIPVVRVPHVVEVPDLAPQRERFGLAEDEFLFLFYFDFHSTTSRKNPEAVLEAFRSAFRPDQPVRLVLKSLNADHQPEALAALKRDSAGQRVTFIDEALSSEDRFRLLRSCDCFVSLHRAEGFGLGMAEAMAYGMPVIATGWSGNMDFMNSENSYPVRFELEALKQADGPYPEGSLWASPDVDDAARQMRRVFEHPGPASAVGAKGKQAIEALCGRQVVGAAIDRRLSLIRGRGVPQGAGSVLLGPPSGINNRLRAGAIGGLRGMWRWTLRVAPPRYHPRLQRWTSRIRRVLASS